MGRYLNNPTVALVSDRMSRRRGSWLTAHIAVITAVLVAVAAAKGAAADTTIRGEDLLPDAAGFSKGVYDANASDSYARQFHTEGTASTDFSGAVSRIELRARGDLCGAAPYVRVFVDGEKIMRQRVPSATYSVYTNSVSVGDGTHRLAVRFPNDRLSEECDRNLYVDYVRLIPLQPASPGTNPFADEKFYVDPNSNARKTADALYAEGRTWAAREMEEIAQSPADPYYMAEWTERHDGIEFYTRHYIENVYQAAGAVPTLGLYAIPHRDCGSYSGGGFDTAAEYKAWIDGATRGSGTHKVIWFLEPDAIPNWECLTGAQKQKRVRLLRYAINKLATNPNAYVYIDACHSGWHTPTTIVNRLNRIGIANAAGFTTNTSNFNWTDNEVAWAKQVSAGVGNKPFVVDTSRNGLGPYTDGMHDGDCPPQINPPGRALGMRPTANTGDPLIHAFFWLKQPGESDGACGGFPQAGTWMPQYALGLAMRSAY